MYRGIVISENGYTCTGNRPTSFKKFWIVHKEVKEILRHKAHASR